MNEVKVINSFLYEMKIDGKFETGWVNAEDFMEAQQIVLSMYPEAEILHVYVRII